MSPTTSRGYSLMGSFDPDGHYQFAVDRRGRYFTRRAAHQIFPDSDETGIALVSAQPQRSSRT